MYTKADQAAQRWRRTGTEDGGAGAVAPPIARVQQGQKESERECAKTDG